MLLSDAFVGNKALARGEQERGHLIAVRGRWHGKEHFGLGRRNRIALHRDSRSSSGALSPALRRTGVNSSSASRFLSLVRV